MRPGKYISNVLIGAAAVVIAGARFVPGHNQSGPVLDAAVSFVSAELRKASSDRTMRSSGILAVETEAALGALAAAVRPLSHPQALEDAFRSYFAYKTAHPSDVKKPYLYFVDYGLPSTTARGYVFDMNSLKVVDGPFMVAHGRGSSKSQYGVPTRFSNASGSEATSLGLYLARETYAFHGKTGGQPYSSVGLRLMGVSDGYNDNALARGVVAHGAPYVTAAGAGRSEGCPAIEPTRARELLPKLADGGMVFLFAPNSNWMADDPWLTAATGSRGQAFPSCAAGLGALSWMPEMATSLRQCSSLPRAGGVSVEGRHMFTPTAADVRVTSLRFPETVRAVPPGPDTDSLIAALRAVHARVESRLDEQTLHAGISDYIARAKSEECLIEHAIVRLKRAIDDAGLSADSGPRAALNSDVITRCIREYYRR